MPPLTILFWNIRGNQPKTLPTRKPFLLRSLARMAVAHAADVIVLAEPALAKTEVVGACNRGLAGPYYDVPSGSEKLHFFSRVTHPSFPTDRLWIERVSGNPKARVSVQELRSLKVTVGGVHCLSQIDLGSARAREEHAAGLVETVRLVEKDVNHTRTVLIGDFNMDPFDPGMTAPRGFHAMISVELTRTVPLRASRGRTNCFYNPTWSLFGDRSFAETATGVRKPLRAPGSYFYDDSREPTHHFWHVFDQVLVRPDLIPHLRWVQPLTTDGTDEFLTAAGRIDEKRFSDHLPLIVRFHFR
jgi:hypothetical protein